jgi:hypothetical protein
MREEPELPAWAKPRRSETRPTWVIVLTFAMLLLGGRFVKTGLDQVVNRRLPWVIDDSVAAEMPREQRVFGEMMVRGAQAHTVAVQVDGVARLVMGGLLLLTVAAVFSSDPRARQAAMVAAWAHIAFQLGDGIFLYIISRQELAAMAPTLLAASQGASKGPAGSVQALLLSAAVSFEVVGLPFIAFSLVQLKFFGGTRGRTFFGAGTAADARPL